MITFKRRNLKNDDLKSITIVLDKKVNMTEKLHFAFMGMKPILDSFKF